MKFLDSSLIDLEKWDEIIENSPKNNVFCYSWYLSASAKKWGAIINEDYSFIMPLPYKKWLVYKKTFQHPYSRNLDFFGSSDLLEEGLKVLMKFNSFLFSMNDELKFKRRIKKYQVIELKKEFSYHKNAQRILQKNVAKFSFRVNSNYKSVLDFYFRNSFYKIKQQEINKFFLENVMKNALLHKKGEVVEVFNEKGELSGAGFFLMDKKTVCYLIGDCDEVNKKEGLMFSLMDFAIKKAKENYSFFDFGGSNIENVATFYRKLGGKDVEYFEYYK